MCDHMPLRKLPGNFLADPQLPFCTFSDFDRFQIAYLFLFCVTVCLIHYPLAAPFFSRTLSFLSVSMSSPAAPPQPAAQSRPAVAEEEEDDDADAAPALSEELLAMLSPEARAALDAHRASQREAAAALAAAQADGSTEIGEDFGLSQFWYSDESAEEMAQVTVAAARLQRPDASPSNPLRIACISAPSAYKALKRLAFPDVRPFVLEFDRRFAKYGAEFVFYDFNEPSHLVSEFPESETGVLRRSFDGVIADPPYLNENTMAKTGETVRLLARFEATPVLFNTGAILRQPIELLLGLKPCVKRPRHRVHIMNEFVSYSNWPAEGLGGWEKDEKGASAISGLS
jgi:hypothetical protein